MADRLHPPLGFIASSRGVLRMLQYMALAVAVTLAPATGSAHSSEARIQAWVDEASAGLDPRVIDALSGIVGADRRLLAVRAYLRAGDTLPERWSWSQQRLESYASTPEGKAAGTDIDAVCAAFSKANPGFTLEVNRQPRSLEVQLAHWNDNASVKATADSLIRQLELRFAGTPGIPSEAALRSALVDWQPPAAATLAAPGLSPHGQGRAFDFQVVRDGRVVAGLDAASAQSRWDAAGWTQRLKSAMQAAGSRFVGPLQSPYEPWHYAYTPPP
jgi:hypothetical protein